MASSKVCRVVLLGAPGSGKGTLAGRLLDHFPFSLISAGDLLRQEISSGSALGGEAAAAVGSGKLVGDELVTRLLRPALQTAHGSSWMLDGFPRTVEQAKWLGRVEGPDAVVELDVPFDVIVDRLSSRFLHKASGRVYNLHFNPPKEPGCDDVTGEALVQRDDDDPETVLGRLETYEGWRAGLCDHYRRQGLLHTFAGSTTDAIWPSVFEFLAKRLEPSRDRREYAAPLPKAAQQ